MVLLTIGNHGPFGKHHALKLKPPQLNLAAAVAMPIMLVTLLCLWAQRHLLGRGSYRTMSGKAAKAQPVALDGWRIPAMLFCGLVVLVTAVLPLAALVILSLLTAYGAPVTLANLTLKNFAGVPDRADGLCGETAAHHLRAVPGRDQTGCTGIRGGGAHFRGWLAARYASDPRAFAATEPLGGGHAGLLVQPARVDDVGDPHTAG